MQELLDEQLGRLLLLAAAFFGVAITFAGGKSTPLFEGDAEVKDAEQLQVELAAEQQAPKEIYFAVGDADTYRGASRHVFVKPKVTKQYEAVELSVPPAAVMRPPGLVTSPGPNLEGTTALPRWGAELPPPKVAVPDPKKP